MQLRIHQNNGSLVIHLRGNLDGTGACQIERALEALPGRSRDKALTIDLSGVHRFEYFGIALLAKRIRRERHHFHEISLTGLQKPTQNVFRRFGLHGCLATHQRNQR
jgi:anti-anti-sigma factor